MSTTNPIFIVGAPRSGTTLITAMLSAHPAIAISPESHFFNYWLVTYQQLPIQTFWQQFSQSRRFSYFGLMPEQVLAQIGELDQLTHQAIFEATLVCYAQQLGKPRWGEKTPMHYQHLATLFEWYPQAQVLWMIRDPRATVASLLKVDWASAQTYRNADLWVQSVKQQQSWLEDQRLKLVRYEDLVTAPEATLREVCAFLNEPFCAAMICDRTPTPSALLNRKGWAKAHLEKSLAPIDKQTLDKWKQTLYPTQINLIEHICYPYMHLYGYVPETDRLTLSASWRWRRERWQARWQQRLTQWRKQLQLPGLADRIHGIASSNRL